MTLGALMAFLQYLAMFYTPLTSIAESTTWFANFFSVSRRICDLLDTPSESGRPAQPVACPAVQGRVELREVSFGYDKSRPVLHDISFTIEPGEMIGVVGRSGSGKSTLVSLIGRLYDADTGRILIDGLRELGCALRAGVQVIEVLRKALTALSKETENKMDADELKAAVTKAKTAIDSVVKNNK